MTEARQTSRARRLASLGFFAFALTVFVGAVLLFRITVVTDYLYHAAVKDPERTPPSGQVIVAPADGTVLYVTRVTAGSIPQVVKRGVAVPLAHHMKTDDATVFPDGYLVGIYMNADGVHVNRAPVAGVVKERIIFNGPHIDMTAAESRIILTQLIPGWVSVKKLLGLAPYAIEDTSDFILKSARETLVIEDERNTDVYVARIADYSVGKILTWVAEGQTVATGEKVGMITWGSQSDVFFADSPGLELHVAVGQFVHAGETVLATY
jgi:phosphatidylserine decarboxylase